MQEQVLKILEDNPQARERRFRHIYFTQLLEQKYKVLNWSDLPDVATDFANCVRSWQMILKDNENLRGQDYKDKTVLQQEKILELGYSMGFEKDLKILESLSIRNEKN